MPAEGSRPIALDSSVAVPLLVHTHDDHPRVETWARGRSLALTSHSLAETYAVLTRLPDDLRISPDDAARLLARGFATPLLVQSQTARNLASVLASSGVAGGAVYDALVASRPSTTAVCWRRAISGRAGPTRPSAPTSR
jgi:hypothetical protein